MSTLQEWVLGWDVFAAAWLVTYHYLALHGWADRARAWYYGLPVPALTAHARWEKSWSRRTRRTVRALGLASVLMLAAAWLLGPVPGLAVTGTAEVSAGFVMQRSRRRAARTERHGHGHV